MIAPAGAVNSNFFSVTGAINIQINANAPACFIQWEVESNFVEGAAGMWINTSSFSGMVMSHILGGAMVQLTETTEHENEAGTGVAMAQTPIFAVAAGPAIAFAAGPVNGAPFADGPEADVLRQNFTINITPPAAGADLSFTFPVNSSTEVPEPGTCLSVAAGLLGLLAYRWRRNIIALTCASSPCEIHIY